MNTFYLSGKSEHSNTELRDSQYNTPKQYPMKHFVKWLVAYLMYNNEKSFAVWLQESATTRHEIVQSSLWPSIASYFITGTKNLPTLYMTCLFLHQQ